MVTRMLPVQLCTGKEGALHMLAGTGRRRGAYCPLGRALSATASRQRGGRRLPQPGRPQWRPAGVTGTVGRGVRLPVACRGATGDSDYAAPCPSHY